MTIKDIKEQLNQFDDDMIVLYNEPIIGALIPLDFWSLKKAVFIQTKDGLWYTEKEFNELKQNNEKFDSDILIKKEQAYLYENMGPEYDSAGFSFDDNFIDDDD